MAPKDINKLLESWSISSHKAFKYYEYLLDEEIITIKRIDKEYFELVPEKSSIKVDGPWYIEDLEKILKRNGLEVLQVNLFNDYWSKSDGCICGAWATSEPKCHAYYCKKYRKY